MVFIVNRRVQYYFKSKIYFDELAGPENNEIVALIILHDAEDIILWVCIVADIQWVSIVQQFNNNGGVP